MIKTTLLTSERGLFLAVLPKSQATSTECSTCVVPAEWTQRLWAARSSCAGSPTREALILPYLVQLQLHCGRAGGHRKEMAAPVRAEGNSMCCPSQHGEPGTNKLAKVISFLLLPLIKVESKQQITCYLLPLKPCKCLGSFLIND